MQENNNKQIVITAFLLIAVIALFQFSNLDIYIQSFFYNFDKKNWLIDKDDKLLMDNLISNNLKIH